ncbi:hypothetical protein FH608_017175 [Nonomuraea phyllanthi]|uniref:Uncharacterized protein n=1 Tax=Nonomuraea phyllanthi TaxID=2219224 RepID=A0A5C4WKQ0_9ACTN|nr:hypothetical protein [Nonomuraea phyllanthi]KAB8194880.1 hypothetical protein FH608_017175 [Nonomuraea phyllanthi]
MNLIDRMIAPNATRAEVVAGFGAAFAGAAVALLLALLGSLPALPATVVTVIAFDLYGGAVVNATSAAKRHYHRPGRTAGHHLTFVALHLQPFLLAWLVAGFSWSAAVVVYGTTLAGAVAVTLAPAALRRPVAFAATAFGLIPVTGLISVPPELAWFAPLLLIKLLLAHLLPEQATYEPNEGNGPA